MSYAAAVDHLYALGHELAPAAPSAPRRKVRPCPHAHPRGRARQSAERLPFGPDRRNQRQRLHGSYAREHPHRCRLSHRALHLAAPHPGQRAHPDRRRRDPRRRLCPPLLPSRRHRPPPRRNRRPAPSPQLLRGPHRAQPSSTSPARAPLAPARSTSPSSKWASAVV